MRTTFPPVFANHCQDMPSTAISWRPVHPFSQKLPLQRTASQSAVDRASLSGLSKPVAQIPAKRIWHLTGQSRVAHPRFPLDAEGAAPPKPPSLPHLRLQRRLSRRLIRWPTTVLAIFQTKPPLSPLSFPVAHTHNHLSSRKWAPQSRAPGYPKSGNLPLQSNQDLHRQLECT